ncbi:MAG: lysophospholipid acyltransferase family protein [Bacteroidota bacterium]|nr:lysophospholipid acyltransferase family protein [Bacteroidota bacterium]
MLLLLSRFFFWLIGWKVKGEVPKSLRQYVMIVAPHTSNWDFFIGIAARSILRIDTRYVAKKELFRFPFGWFFRKLGGYPVDRSKTTNFVDAVADLFNKNPDFAICLTPEGTRSYAPKWKSGFYYIALKAGLPIVMVGFNYARKEVAVEPPFMPSGDIDKDMEFMMNHYRTIPGKFPEKGIQ